jgi:hypothetical protein
MGQDGDRASDGASSEQFHTHLRPYCGHAGAREIRMYTAYADANGVRLRLISSTDNRWRHVSMLYEIPNGWAWTICDECPADASGAGQRRRAAG